ncbi:MAG: histidine kinase [Candidatus Eisenbacteria bacterium]|uniref:Histidine kinase n=1 Tax=Eiseniibacteriota bacterium TaxID=2212470 RepID=A0A938BNN9_UNCEI|nr:histidine kinase [Candidatus Eisenbacteria bacterium]
MESRSLEDIAGGRLRRRVSYAELMPWQVRQILVVSSLYDSFTFQEDGNLTEMLFSQYVELNLNYTPSIERVSTAEEAIARVRENPPDLVISMPRVGGMDILDFGRAVKAIRPDLPLFLLAYDTRELSLLEERDTSCCVDRIFVWQGDTALFLAIIKLVEDGMNAGHDAEIAGVKCILLVEDSARFYSSYLPLLYTEIMEQTQELMAETVNRMERLLRMRARPKILLAASYEEGAALFDRHREHILGVIVDARFPRGGEPDGEAGRRFIGMVRMADADVPVLMQSSEPENREAALRLGAAFLAKDSPTLLSGVRRFLRDDLGFGDFVFRRPDGSLVTTAKDLRGMVAALGRVPDDSLLHHAGRNDFSTWLMARTEFDLAKALRPRRFEEFGSAAAVRGYLLAVLEEHRGQRHGGLVAEFSGETFDATTRFTRIGGGSLGGKGRGLAFIHWLFDSYDIASRLPDVRIQVPPTAVVATDAFDRFMAGAGLTAFALQEPDDRAIRHAFLEADLPADTVEALRAFLARVDYPLAVRSSSLLEDSSHQPFAGIYRTYMLPNNDPDPSRRLDDLCRAIRLVYASTYCADSKSYIESTPNRLEEEKMAVVIQQIVGRRHGSYLYPDAAGVGRSYDYYPMPPLRSEDGVASVALGLGRIVVDGGRCVRFSPAQPRRLHQFASSEDFLENSQREFYALDLSRPAPVATADDPPDANLVRLDAEAAARHGTLAAAGSVYSPENDAVYPGTHRSGMRLITMAGFTSADHYPLPAVLRFLMDLGRGGLSCHIEIEFAALLRSAAGQAHEFAFLQVRPLVMGAPGREVDLGDIRRAETICASRRALGHGRLEGIRDVVYVPAQAFDRRETVAVAGEIGAINARLRREQRPFLLIGPGRWGSADPWLGIPVRWTQISGVRCVVEAPLADMRVEPSQGSHFFQNITSFGIGYFTLGETGGGEPAGEPAGEQAGDGRGAVEAASVEGAPPAVAFGDFLDEAWLETQPAFSESPRVRHLRFEEPLEVVIDGRRGMGAVMKPGRGRGR